MRKSKLSSKQLTASNSKTIAASRLTGFQRAYLRFLGLTISKENRQYFLDNLSMQISAGLDLLESLGALENDSHVRSMKRIIRAIAIDVSSGSSLASAISATNLLAPHVISLIRIGEESGKLAENLEVLAGEQEKEREFSARVRSALFYPVFVLGITVVLGLAIAWFVLPNVLKIFEQINVPLPLPTRILISVSTFFQSYGYIAVPSILIGGMLFIYLLFINKHTKFIGQRLMYSIPGIRRLIVELEIARMGYILGTLLNAGLPITDALGALQESSTIWMYKKLYKKLHDQIELGDTFKDVFHSKGAHRKLIPITIQQVIMSGEQAGTLAKSMEKIGRIYEAKTENTTRNVSVIIEPVLLVIVWVGVVFIALAVVMPIYSLVGGFNNGAY